MADVNPTSSAKIKAAKSEHEEHLSDFDEDVDTPDPRQLKQIKKKIDIRICLVLGVLYTASLIDRVNLPVSSQLNLSAQ
jgi:hypothetical protein